MSDLVNDAQGRIYRHNNVPPAVFIHDTSGDEEGLKIFLARDLRSGDDWPEDYLPFDEVLREDIIAYGAREAGRMHGLDLHEHK